MDPHQPFNTSKCSCPLSRPHGRSVHVYPSIFVPPIQSSASVKVIKHDQKIFSSFEINEPASSVVELKEEHIQLFWEQKMAEMEQISEFKQYQLPVARIWWVMKADDVKMISLDAPVLLGKACELFIMELTFRSWLPTEEDTRRTVQIGDISHAISDAKTLKFLDVLLPHLHEPPLQQDQFTTGSRVQGALLLPPQYTNYQQQPLLTNQFWPNCNKTSYDQVIYQNLYANYEQQPLPTNQFWPNYYETIYDEGGGAEGLLGRDNYPHI